MALSEKYYTSNNIKVFPCSFRGTFNELEDNSNNKYTFDIEASLNTEFNYVNLPGNSDNSHQSYIIEYREPISYAATSDTSGNSADNAGVLRCSIGGYYFEIYEFTPTANLKLGIKLAEYALNENTEDSADRTRTTKVLCPTKVTESISILDEKEGEVYYFTGVEKLTTASDTTGFDYILDVTDGDGNILPTSYLPIINHGSGNDSIIIGSLTANASANGVKSLAQGNYVLAEGDYSHAEGQGDTEQLVFAGGIASHAEGFKTQAAADYAHAEGEATVASKQSSHAEGLFTKASGSYSHSEGQGKAKTGEETDNTYTTASGEGAHAEGYCTTANGKYSHSEGKNTVASGEAAHATGIDTEASEIGTFTAGHGTIASVEYQTVVGKYNKTEAGEFIVGIGTEEKNSEGNVTSTTKNNALVVNDRTTNIESKLIIQNNSDSPKITLDAQGESTTIYTKINTIGENITTAETSNLIQSKSNTIQAGDSEKITQTNGNTEVTDATITLNGTAKTIIKSNTINSIQLADETHQIKQQINDNKNKTIIRDDDIEILGNSGTARTAKKGETGKVKVSDRLVEVYAPYFPYVNSATTVNNTETNYINVVAEKAFASTQSEIFKTKREWKTAAGDVYKTKYFETTDTDECIGLIVARHRTYEDKSGQTQSLNNHVQLYTDKVNGEIAISGHTINLKNSKNINLSGDNITLTGATTIKGALETSNSAAIAGNTTIGGDTTLKKTLTAGTINASTSSNYINIVGSSDRTINTSSLNIYSASSTYGEASISYAKGAPTASDDNKIWTTGSNLDDSTNGISKTDYFWWYHNSTTGGCKAKLAADGTFSAIKFNISSDRRLKENIEDTKFDAESILDQIKIRDFTWKADKDHKQQVGVIAQELAEIMPEEIKDCFIDTTSAVFSVSESKLVYLLIKAYQEEKSKRIEIENRLNKLEGKD